jgi:hypothetical protein
VDAGGDLYLNMGARNSNRGIGENEGDELYMVEHLGGDAAGDGEIVRVKFSGREKIYRGVKRIIAFAGAGDDHIYVGENVSSPVEFHGEGGNDVFIYDGTGTAILDGGLGMDYMVVGANAGTSGGPMLAGGYVANLTGGGGQDYIVNNSAIKAFIDGGDDASTVRRRWQRRDSRRRW